jgi:hypothetical protein
MEPDKIRFDLLASRTDEKVHVQAKGVRSAATVSDGPPGTPPSQLDPMFRSSAVATALELHFYLHRWSRNELKRAFEFRPIGYQVRLR